MDRTNASFATASAYPTSAQRVGKSERARLRRVSCPLAEGEVTLRAMDKLILIEQLAARLRESAAVARRSGQDAAVEAREGATPAEKREDARVALEQGSLARGQAQRAA